MRSSAEPVRPSIWRLSKLIRLTWPSTTQKFQGSVRPAMTASRSRSMPAAKVWRLGRSSWRTASSHCGSCSPLAFGEHGGEGPDVTGQGAEFRAVGWDGLEPELFDHGQRRGSAGDPSRHHAGYWRIARDWLDHRLARGSRRRTARAADGKAGDWLAPPPPHDLGRGRLRQPRLQAPHLGRRSRRRPAVRPHRLRTPPAPRPRRRDSRPHCPLELRQRRS